MVKSAGTYERTTVVFPINERVVLLGMKKRGFGEGWWNGFGGKLKDGETYEVAAARETFEEARIRTNSLLHIANLHFYFNDVLGVVSKAYMTQDFTGDPEETAEMRPEYFDIDQLPFDEMWPADKLWVPDALATSSPLGFIVHFDSDKSFRMIQEVSADLLEEKF